MSNLEAAQRQLARRLRPKGQPVGIVQGVVSANNSDGTVDVKEDGSDEVIPSIDLMGATVAGQSVWMLRFGDGDRLALGASGGAALTFEADWQDFSGGGAFAVGAYGKAGGLVHVEGLVERAAAGTDPDTIAVLPSGFRPARNHIFACFSTDATSGGLVRVDVQATGEIVVRGLDTGIGEWVSLSGITFQAA